MTARVFYPQARAILKLVFDGFGETAQDTPPVIVPVLPKSVSIQRNSYKQADSWEMTFEANDLPIDPALIRAGFVEIFLFQVDGVTERDQRIIRKDFTKLNETLGRKPRSLNDTTALEADLSSTRDRFTFGNNPQIAGQIDEIDMDMGTDGKTVSISGQDFTAFLIGRTWPFRLAIEKTAQGAARKKVIARRIDVGQRLDVLISKWIREAEPSGMLRLSVEEISPGELPIVGNREIRNNKRGIPIKQGANYWDVIYKVATRYGFIAYVRGTEVVLSRPKNLRDKMQSKVKRVAWGNNLESLRMSRHMGKEKVPRIIMRSYDEKTRDLISVEFPEKGQPAPTGTVGVEEDEFQIFTLHGVSDRQALSRAAQNLFELIGRGERQMVAVTKDLRDIDGNTMLDLEAGDAIEVEFVDIDRTEFLGLEGEDERFSYLVARGFNETIAQVIVDNFTKLLAIKRPMRFRSGRLDFDVETGTSVEMELVDFVVIDGQRTRENKTPRKAQRNRIRDTDGNQIGEELRTLL